MHFKLFDTSQGKMDLEYNVNKWLSRHTDIQIISSNLTWDQSNLVYTLLYLNKAKKPEAAAPASDAGPVQ